MSFDTFVYIVEVFSITAFGISGALIATQAKLDTFGVVCLGVISSLGGGILRDMMIGITPPISFFRPLYAITAAVSALLTFLVEYYMAKKHLSHNPKADETRDLILFIVDSIGLGTFTSVGVAVAYEYTTDCNSFAVVVAGCLTGFGGGIIRDVLVGKKPYIFTKHFYASASIIGAIITTVTWYSLGKIQSMILGAVVVIILRILAKIYKWNMPTVPYKENSENNH